MAEGRFRYVPLSTRELVSNLKRLHEAGTQPPENDRMAVEIGDRLFAAALDAVLYELMRRSDAGDSDASEYLRAIKAVTPTHQDGASSSSWRRRRFSHRRIDQQER